MTTKKTYAFSRKAMRLPTPTWAKNMFYITFTVTTALGVFMAGTQIIPENVKFEVMLVLKALDGLILGFSRMYGIEIQKVR